MKLITTLLISFWMLSANADSNLDIARELAGMGAGASQNLENFEDVLPNATAFPPNAESYYGGGNIIPKGPGQGKINDCANLPGDENLFKRQECEGINFVGRNKTQRPDVTIDNDENFVSKTTEISKDPKDTLIQYGWDIPYNQDGSIGEIPIDACGTEKITIPPRIYYEDCSIYTGSEAFLCESILKVTVDPSFNYSCLETKYNNSYHDCSKELKVTCEKATTCANQGIKLASWQGDMAVSMTPIGTEGVYKLVFGTIGDDYWKNGNYDRKLTFNIQNLSELTVFKLVRVEYDDWMYVEVNGSLVWSVVTGKRLTAPCKNSKCSFEAARKVYSQPGNAYVGYAEKRTSWKQDTNIDIRPYLREGSNVIRLYTIVGGGGEGNAWFHAQQYCTPTCSEKWQGCESYESKVKP